MMEHEVQIWQHVLAHPDDDIPAIARALGFRDKTVRAVLERIGTPDIRDMYISTANQVDVSQGKKFDDGKDRIELFPPEALFAISRVLTFGARKYADRNWEKGMNWSRAFGALMRHLWAWWRGEEKDPETGYSHLWHAGCCIVFLIAWEARGHGTDDRSPYGQPTNTQRSETQFRK